MAWTVLENIDKRLKAVIGIVSSIGVIGYAVYITYDYYHTLENYKAKVNTLERQSAVADSIATARILKLEKYIDAEVVRFNTDSTFQVGFRSDKTNLFYRDKDGREYRLYKSSTYSTENQEWFFYVKDGGIRHWVSSAHYEGWPGNY